MVTNYPKPKMATNYPKMVTHFPKPKMVQRSLPLSRVRCLTTNIPRNSSVDQEEMKRFSRVAQEWWNPSGPYSVLYRMNPVRVGYIRNTLDQLNLDEDGKIRSEASATFPLKGMSILDVGCGGGFLSHSLSRLGAQVTAVDANQETIQVARSYKSSQTDTIEFLHSTAEELVHQKRLFDAVCALEILEHVSDPQDFLYQCSQLVKPGGFLFFSTINRTPLSYIGTILLAEKVLGWVPNGTHSYEKYITPKELESYCVEAGITIYDTTGMIYNPITKTWSLAPGKNCNDFAMNYIMTGRKTP